METLEKTSLINLNSVRIEQDKHHKNLVRFFIPNIPKLSLFDPENAKKALTEIYGIFVLEEFEKDFAEEYIMPCKHNPNDICAYSFILDELGYTSHVVYFSKLTGIGITFDCHDEEKAKKLYEKADERLENIKNF